ncbi:hypothetical protein [Mycobacterium cookii]|uniref:hypothetical protein n=1 Tax=Mycobacterium cookii TaxID=1775 RepID=UPI0013D3A334|nr:hypothetical protein [Mycobacterium cookii]MCV7328787.1 hypothetical protein [Mycobacterium cookii]
MLRSSLVSTSVSDDSTARRPVLAGVLSVLASAAAILGSGAAMASPLSTVPHNAHLEG